ncbi:MAG: rhomboid family intramembrane serine protease [Bacteroidales bacterium]|nr:rhomboid family intramembrane serine protease [Bacteroidales bacterium]
MTIFIIIITVIVSITAFQNKELFYKFSFSPYSVIHQKQWYRTFSHALIHADWVHLLINMFVLYSFGKADEHYFQSEFGNRYLFYYFLLYAGAVFFSVLVSLVKHKNDYNYNSVGASGAVSAVIFSCILFNPWSGVYLMFIPIEIPGFIFGIFYLIYSVYMAKKGKDNIGHDAHFAGAIFGFIFPVILNPNLFLTFINQIIYFL